MGPLYAARAGSDVLGDAELASMAEFRVDGDVVVDSKAAVVTRGSKDRMLWGLLLVSSLCVLEVSSPWSFSCFVCVLSRKVMFQAQRQREIT